MVIDTSKMGLGSWRTTLTGGLTAAGLAVAAWLSSGNKLDYKNPLLWAAVFKAIEAYYEKDKNITGGTTLAAGSVPDAQLHAAAANEAAAPPAVPKV